MKQGQHFKRLWSLMLLLIAMLMPQGAWAGACAYTPGCASLEDMQVHLNGTNGNYNGSANNEVVASLKFNYWLDIFNYDGDNGYWDRDLTMKIDGQALTFYSDYACTTKVSTDYSTVLQGIWGVFGDSNEDHTIGKNKSGSGNKAYFKTSSGLKGYINIYNYYAASNKWTTMKVEVFIYDLYGHKVSVCGTYKRSGKSDIAYDYVFYLGGCPRPKNVTTSRNTTTKQVTVSWQKETYSIPASDATGETRVKAYNVIDNGNWGVYRNDDYTTSIQTVGNTTISAADDGTNVAKATCSSSPYTYNVCYEPKATYGNNGTSLKGDVTHQRGLVGSSSITLDHVWGEASWKWDDDGHSATCTRACTQCSQGDASKTSVTVTLNNGITDEQQVAPNCTTKGTTRYTATATVAGTQYTSTKDVSIAALNHDYQQVVDANYFVSAATCGDGVKYHKKCSRCSTKEGPIWENLESRPAHTFAASDANHDVCTVCNHGFFHYSASKKVDPSNPAELKDKDGQTLTIKTHTFSNGQGVIEFVKPLAYIGYQAFYNRSNLLNGSLTIPNTVTIIGSEAFYACRFDGTLIIPNSVTQIGRSAFYDCWRLNRVQMASVPKIETSTAFYGITSNKHVVLNENSYVYKGNDSNFPTVNSVTAPCNLDLTGSAVASHANLTLVHNYSNVVDANYLADRATCTTDATYFKKCSGCTTKGEKWTASGTALDHDYSQVVDEDYLVSAATCGSDAVYHEKCSRCDTHGAVWSATGTATGNHSYTNNTLTASPVEDGLYAYACDNGCGTHTDDHIIKDFYGEGNHLELTKDGEGNYSTSEGIIINDRAFFYSPVGFSSPVDFSAPSVTFNREIWPDDGMYSFIVPFDIPADQAAELGKFYQYRTHGEGKVYFDDITTIDNADGIVRANTAYFFKPAKNITSITVDDAEIKATTSMPNAENPSEPGLYGTYSQIDIPVGAYGYGNMGFFIKAGTNNLLRPFRAYLWLGSGASMARARAFFGDYDVDAIELIGADDLDLNAPIYNLQGQRIVTPKKGEIYIQNGKKVMKK